MWHEELFSVEVAERIVENISQARKIFKFLKFLDSLQKISNTFQDAKKALLIRILTLLSNVCAFFYYISDNIVWFANIGMVRKVVYHKLKWKRFKDFFCLWKNAFNIARAVLIWLKNYKKEHDMLAKLNKRSFHLVQLNSEAHSQIRELIIFKRKRRFEELSLFQSMLRIVMLIYRLKIPPFCHKIHPIVVAICGGISNLIAIFKLLSEDKSFIKLKKKDQKTTLIK